MSNQEISIIGFQLEDCKGDLGGLKSNWMHVPTISSTVLEESKGSTVQMVVASLESTKQVKESFDSLLENSLDFFTKMGIAFQQNDEKAAQNINSLAKGQ